MSVLEKVLRKSHLISVIIIILVELAFLIAVVSCCSIQSKSKKLHILSSLFFFLSDTQGQILAALLIVLSFLALMTLIYFLRKYLFDLLISIINFYSN
jgi:hypothetical protein